MSAEPGALAGRPAAQPAPGPRDLPLEEVACYLCGGSAGPILVDDPPFKVRLCSGCGLGYTSPRIRGDRLHELYDAGVVAEKRNDLIQGYRAINLRDGETEGPRATSLLYDRREALALIDRRGREAFAEDPPGLRLVNELASAFVQPNVVNDRAETEWRRVQARFVDNPDAAVRDADGLVAQVMAARGYPVEDFDTRAADLSVNHPRVVENYRTARELARRRERGEAGTEELRQAVINYRALFGDLLDVHDTTPRHSERRAS